MREAEEKAREEAQKRAEERQRRPSRFHVSPAIDMLNCRQMSENQLNVDQVSYHS